ncbi:hypothetical Protein YC6258_02748 [Gynuella sunshinyii YC6258]|uniref:Uncharacterized protein n=1 Tax=Gynuella sunshinyii YC6258 TaxID=1445510 RepID=A0A0C5VKI8_9GAMM|nr:hypothetical Protein YC6258_02748 [Gynuella sunshinyii YC6258]
MRLPTLVLKANKLSFKELENIYASNQKIYFEEHNCMTAIFHLIENPDERVKSIYEVFCNTVIVY